jgi:hypothetical protein
MRWSYKKYSSMKGSYPTLENQLYFQENIYYKSIYIFPL